MRLNSIKEIDPIKDELAAAAQNEYDNWIQDEHGYNDELGSGGICHLIADELIDVLYKHNIHRCQTVSSCHEQHVYVVGQFREGIYLIDVPYQYYETGGGFTWKKRPNIKFDADYIHVHRLDSNPRKLSQYTDEMEESVAPKNDELQLKVKNLEQSLEQKYPEIDILHLYIKSNGSLFIGSIRIKPEHRRKGQGREIIHQIKKFADDHNLIISLAPEAEPRYKEKLDKFYKSLGFVNNKGRKRDYQLSDPFCRTMYRRPGINEIEYPLAKGEDAQSYRGEEGWKGKIVWMTPDKFLHLCYPLPDREKEDESSKNLEYRMKNNLPIDTLVLVVDVAKRKVTGHEGRHRATVAKKLGIKQVPVLIYTGSIFKRVPKWDPEDHEMADKAEFKPEWDK